MSNKEVQTSAKQKTKKTRQNEEVQTGLGQQGSLHLESHLKKKNVCNDSNGLNNQREASKKL